MIALQPVYDEINKKIKNQKNPNSIAFKIFSKNIPIFKNFGEVISILKRRLSSSYATCRLATNIGGNKYELSFCVNSAHKLGASLIKLAKNEPLEKDDYRIFKTLFHELYHTKNKAKNHTVEECFTEMNAHLMFKDNFFNLTGLSVSNEILEYLTHDYFISYQKEIYTIINLFNFVGIPKLKQIEIFKDLKNKPLLTYKENNQENHLYWVNKIIDFVVYIDKYHYKCLDFFKCLGYNEKGSDSYNNYYILRKSKKFSMDYRIIKNDFSRSHFYSIDLYNPIRDLIVLNLKN